MQLPHDGSLLGRIDFEIQTLLSRAPSADAIPDAGNDIMRTISVLSDARTNIRLAAIEAGLDDLQKQKDIDCDLSPLYVRAQP